MQFIGCQGLCDGAPVRHIQSGVAGDAAVATLSNAIDTGTARAVRLILAFAAAAGNKLVSIQWSDDGETWYMCDVDLTNTVGDTEGKNVISLCLESEKRFVRAEFMTPNAFSIIAELAGVRHSPASCGNDQTAECSIDCTDMTLVEV